MLINNIDIILIYDSICFCISGGGSLFRLLGDCYYNKDKVEQGSPHLQTHLQAGFGLKPVLSSLYPSLISFSSFIFLSAPYRISFLFLRWPFLSCCHHNNNNDALRWPLGGSCIGLL